MSGTQYETREHEISIVPTGETLIARCLHPGCRFHAETVTHADAFTAMGDATEHAIETGHVVAETHVRNLVVRPVAREPKAA